MTGAPVDRLRAAAPSSPLSRADTRWVGWPLVVGLLVTVVYLAVFASAVGYVIYFELLDRLGAIDITLVSYTVPVFAALSGWLVLGESLDFAAVAGFVVIFAGFLLLKQATIRDRIATHRNTNATDRQ